MVAVQNAAGSDDTATAMAILTTGQSFGGSIFLAIAQVIFSQALRSKLPQAAPDVNAELLVNAGATGFRDLVPAKDLQAVLKVYSQSIGDVFYLNVGLSIVQLIFAFGVGWKNVSKKNKENEGNEQGGH